MIGPLLCSLLMNKFGTNGFFVHLLFFHLVIGAFGLYRITKRSYKDNPESTFTPLPRNITPLGIELGSYNWSRYNNTQMKRNEIKCQK